MSASQTLPASSGTALFLQKDETVKITNTHGRQVVDFWALNPSDPAEYLSMSHNHAIHRKVHFKVGDTLYSSISQPILSWVDDTSKGDHDTLISACNPLRYERMGVKGWHASCAENYQKAVKGLSTPSISQDMKDRLPITAPTPLNLFMNVKVNEEGGIVFRAPTSNEGDYVAFKALMDVIIVLSACPMDQRASGDWLPSPREVHYAVVEVFATSPKQPDPYTALALATPPPASLPANRVFKKSTVLNMPVTITLCSSHSVDNKNTKVTDFAQGTHDLLETALKTARAKESSESEKILQSSFADADLKDSNVHAAANGFVHTAIEAYSENHHLTIRPEDVWFAILSQLNIWINTNAQEARGKIFAHDGKKSLTLNVQNGDFGKLAEDITREIEKNATSPEMREWIMPAFTTTTATDTVVASALLMGAIPEYSCDLAPSECYSQTFPPVTLFGEQSDWEELYKKLDKLETFGTEPAQFGSLLKPVISRFIKSFNDPNGDDVVGFWGHMISDASSNAGEYFGWISAFCFWSKEGEDLHDRHIQFRGGRGFTLDGVIYHNIDSSQIQPVYVSVPVKVNDNGKELDTIMIAGSVGTRYTSSDGAGTGSGVGLDSVNPVSGWWIFVKKDNVEETAEAIEASSGKLPDDTEPATSAPDQQAVALQEDSPVTPASSSSVKDQGLISRLINLFSRTDISK